MFEHSVLDTLYLIPFLLVTYLAMEWLEHKAGDKAAAAVRRAGAAGPVVGSLVGVVPQCGFSAAAATLYAGRVVTLGTLFAVLLSTSDELLPIFLAERVPFEVILKILGVKVAIGMVMGFALDAVLRLTHREDRKLRIHELCERDRCHCNGDCAACREDPELVYGSEHDSEHEHDHSGGSIVRSAVKHTLQVGVFIFLITIALNVVLETVGEDALATLLHSNQVLSILGSALVGLVPNCAASVVVAQLYVDGALGAGALIAGSLVSAGVGLLVLLRANRRPKENAAIIAALVITGAAWGLVIGAAGITF